MAATKVGSDGGGGWTKWFGYKRSKRFRRFPRGERPSIPKGWQFPVPVAMVADGSDVNTAEILGEAIEGERKRGKKR